MDRNFNARQPSPFPATPERKRPEWALPKAYSRTTERKGAMVLPLIHATIGQCLFSFGTWRVRELNAEGAFVEMQGAQPGVGTMVDVCLRHQWHGIVVEHRLLAVVTRVEGSGLFLNFYRCSDAQRASLTALARTRD